MQVTGSSSLSANANLVISGSRGQGVFVSNNSHATLDGAHITGGQHGGLVAMNLSTITLIGQTAPTEVSANATDVFCDSKSVIAGAANVANATTIKCGNLLSDIYEPTP